MDDEKFTTQTSVKANTQLAELIAARKVEKERQEKAKIAEACLEIYEEAANQQSEMADQYRVEKAALQDKLATLKELTSAVENFEESCDPEPLMRVMGKDYEEFCRINNIKN